MFQEILRLRSENARSLSVDDSTLSLDWINSVPLSLHKELAGKLVIFYFWSDLSIHALHGISWLHAVMDHHHDAPIAIVGIHESANTDRERLSHSVSRHAIRFPVALDVENHFHKLLSIQSWPTLACISPQGTILHAFFGEEWRYEINTFIGDCLRFFESDAFSYHNLPSVVNPHRNSSTSLFYPEGLAINETRLAVADTANHRILICDPEGNRIQILGKDRSGYVNGGLEHSLFCEPRGLTFYKNSLYICDSGNHAIRRVDLDTYETKTVSGTGLQGYDRQGGQDPRYQDLNSPWDIALCGDRLYITMAGLHQIWVLDPLSLHCEVLAGSGASISFDSDAPLTSSWAQPSGITSRGHSLFISDLQTHKIRSLNTVSGHSATIAGGNPLGPYAAAASGDRRGPRSHTLFNSPTSITIDDDANILFTADSRNDRIAMTRLSVGQSEDIVDADKLFEPTAVAFDKWRKRLLIADRNHHRIVSLEMTRGLIEEVSIQIEV